MPICRSLFVPMCTRAFYHARQVRNSNIVAVGVSGLLYILRMSLDIFRMSSYNLLNFILPTEDSILEEIEPRQTSWELVMS